MCFLLLIGTNNIFAMAVWYFSESAAMRAQELTNRQRQYDILEEVRRRPHRLAAASQPQPCAAALGPL